MIDNCQLLNCHRCNREIWVHESLIDEWARKEMAQDLPWSPVKGFRCEECMRSKNDK